MTPVDPLEGLDLPAGDPDSLFLQLTRVTAWSGGVTNCGTRQKQALAAVTENDWKGLAAAGARTGAQRVTGAYDRAATDLDRVGRVLRACAAEWLEAQDSYHLARQMADEAMMEEAASCTVSGRPPGDSHLRNRARALASEALAGFNRATRHAVETLDDLAADINRVPGFISRPGHSWYHDPLQWGSDGWHMATAGPEATFRAAEYILENPPQLGRLLNDGMQIMGGAALMTESSAGFGGGVVLDLTGIGLPVGIPLDVLSAAGLASGAGLTAHGTLDALRDLGHSYSVSSDGGGRYKGPDPKAVGDERVARVVKYFGDAVKGTGRKINVAGWGRTDIDVELKDGTIIEVGGPAKGATAKGFDRFKTQIGKLNAYGQLNGVPVRFMYAPNTQQFVIDYARDLLGATNVGPIP